jgi:hypothetical protein
MKIFDIHDKQYWSNKVNFVDDNNVLVGFDTDQSCCEHAGWFIQNTIWTEGDIPDDQTSVDGAYEDWNFDPSFFQEVNPQGDYGSVLDDGGCVVFRLTKGTQEKYLHLFNSHNGYYGHGFEATIGGLPWQSGGI